MDQTSSNNQSQKRPWSWIWMLIISVLCGLPGGYLIVWQNPKVAGFSWSLLGWGFLGLILYLALVFFVALIFPQ